MKQMKIYYVMLLIGVTFLVTVVADVAELSTIKTPRTQKAMNRVPAWKKFRPKVQAIMNKNLDPSQVKVIQSELY